MMYLPQTPLIHIPLPNIHRLLPLALQHQKTNRPRLLRLDVGDIGLQRVDDGVRLAGLRDEFAGPDEGAGGGVAVVGGAGTDEEAGDGGGVFED